MNEWFEVVDETGTVIGCARRAICHRTPALPHRVVHVMVMDAAGRFLLQKRSMRKDIQPGKWDTGLFTPNFSEEYRRYNSVAGNRPH